MINTFISWNIDSLNAAFTGSSARGAMTLELLKSLSRRNPDILAIQETKLPVDDSKVVKLIDSMASYFPGYRIVHRDSASPARKSYAGTMVLYKEAMPQPRVTFPEINAPDAMDAEGRIITLEFANFFLSTVYTPNSGSGLAVLEKRSIWDERFRSYMQTLDKKKPVIVGGDFNVAHEEIDLAHPQSNHFSAGFTDQEREQFDNLLGAGFTDSFRHHYGEVQGHYAEGRSIYTWFAQRAATSKSNNSGWRIDYWLVSNRLADNIIDSQPLDSGSRLDHLPIMLIIDL